MALEGNLSSFGISEILQLIAVQQKTGMLTVNSDDRNVVMFFRDGQLVSTRDRRRKAKDPFRDYVTRYGILDREALARVSQIAMQSKLDFVDIVSSEGLLAEDELARHWRKQIQESMHDVLTWDQCSYKFISNEEIVQGIKTIGEFSIEAMLMESMRRIDEFPHTLTLFPNDRILVTRVDGAKVPDKSKSEDDDEGLTRNERDILKLLTGIVSIRDLIATAKMPFFEVYEALKLLKDRGLIKTKDESPGTSETAREKKTAGRRGPGNVLPYIGALFLFIGATGFGFYRPALRVLAGGDVQVTVLQDPIVARARVEHRIRWALEAYRAQNGGYPETLNELRVAGLTDERSLSGADAHDLRYRLTAGRSAYTLL